MKALLKKHGDKLFAVFRIVVGVLFLFHGLQKFGVFGDPMQPVMSLFGAAAVIETVVGLAVTLGVFARYAAVLGALEMLVAYVMVHASGSWNPLVNKGELALLYFAAFLVIASQGSGIWSVKKD
jgi:putative oxidoreductase